MNTAKRLVRVMGLLSFILLAPLTLWAQVPEAASDAVPTEKTPAERESIFNYKSESLGQSHFTWGGEVGASVDIGGYDLSTFDLDLIIGYKNSWIRTLGISAGLHRDFSAGTHFVPLQVVFRSPLTASNKICFLNLKSGYSFNTVNNDSGTHGGFILTTGIGFNLAMSKNFNSHLILSYEYIRLNKKQNQLIDKRRTNVDLIQILFGVTF